MNLLINSSPKTTKIRLRNLWISMCDQTKSGKTYYKQAQKASVTMFTLQLHGNFSKKILQPLQSKSHQELNQCHNTMSHLCSTIWKRIHFEITYWIWSSSNQILVWPMWKTIFHQKRTQFSCLWCSSRTQTLQMWPMWQIVSIKWESTNAYQNCTYQNWICQM